MANSVGALDDQRSVPVDPLGLSYQNLVFQFYFYLLFTLTKIGFPTRRHGAKPRLLPTSIREVARSRISSPIIERGKFTLTPMPRITNSMPSEVQDDSVKTPASFWPSIKMSLGHLITGGRGTNAATASAKATAAVRVICGAWTGDRRGRRITEK